MSAVSSSSSPTQLASTLCSIISNDFSDQKAEGFALINRAIIAGNEYYQSHQEITESRQQLGYVLYEVKQFFGDHKTASRIVFMLWGKLLGYTEDTKQNYYSWISQLNLRRRRRLIIEPEVSAAANGLAAVQRMMERQGDENSGDSATGRRSLRNVGRVDYSEGGFRGQSSRGKGGANGTKGGRGRGGKKKPASGGRGSTKKKTGRGV